MKRGISINELLIKFAILNRSSDFQKNKKTGMLEVSKLQEDSRLKDSFLRSHSIDYPTSTRKQREAKLLGHPADKRSSLHFARSNYIRSVFCKQLAYFFRYRASLRLRAESIRPGNNLATYC